MKDIGSQWEIRWQQETVGDKMAGHERWVGKQWEMRLKKWEIRYMEDTMKQCKMKTVGSGRRYASRKQEIRLKTVGNEVKDSGRMRWKTVGDEVKDYERSRVYKTLEDDVEDSGR